MADNIAIAIFYLYVCLGAVGFIGFEFETGVKFFIAVVVDCQVRR